MMKKEKTAKGVVISILYCLFMGRIKKRFYSSGVVLGLNGFS